ncbi:hypothetical protein JHK87_001796 [Glycine soja]|nr:hypothetical protein JHK87_001796 [Glycine soja]
MFLGDINSKIERACISIEAMRHESFVFLKFKKKKNLVYGVLESSSLTLPLIFSLMINWLHFSQLQNGGP